MVVTLLESVQSRLCRMRQLRGFVYRWRYLIVLLIFVYGVFLYIPIAREHDRKQDRLKFSKESLVETYAEEKYAKVEEARNDEAAPAKKTEGKSYLFSPAAGEPFHVAEVMTDYGISLEEKFSCKADKNAPAKILLSINAGHGQEHLGGCPDWNCKLTHDRAQMDTADALLLMYQDPAIRKRKDQYLIYFSQESPKNSGINTPASDYFNMSLGFRHDSPSASPYGYTVRLAPQSYREGELVNRTRIEGKKKGAAWFVSHCSTNSQRENLVQQLRETFVVDIYGSCGTFSCQRGGACEEALDNDYHFYVAFENSICKDYITEKLWNQGYKRDIVPLVLKRSLAAPFVPPNSFIAVDDFKTTQQLGDYLQYLMDNKTAYMEYFNWRREYKVIFLDGNNHDVLERPWGFCQICRLMWEQPKKEYIIHDFNKYWYDSCEADGQLVQPIITKSQKTLDKKKEVPKTEK